MDDMRIAETRVQSRGAFDSVERAVDRLDGEPVRLLRPGLKVGLVELHDVRARLEQVPHLFVDGYRKPHGQGLLVVVVVVLRLLRHGERTGQRGLDQVVGVGAEKLDVAYLDGSSPPYRTHYPRDGVGVSGAVQRSARIVEVHALKRGGESV